MDTPMKKTKGNINNLKLKTVNDFSYIELHKRDEREYSSFEVENFPELHNKKINEIISDFKLVFQSNAYDISFAITYDFIGKDEDKHTVQFSTIDNGNIIHSKFFTVTEANSILRDLNKEIRDFKNENPEANTAKVVIDALKQSAMKEKFDINQEVNKAQVTVNSFLEQKGKETLLTEMTKDYNETQEYINENIQKIKNTIESSSEKEELTDLLRRVKVMENIIRDKESKLKDEANLPEAIAKRELLAKKIEAANNEVNKGVEVISANLNSIIRSKVKFK